MLYPQAALILAAHGSSINSQAGLSTRRHAKALREQNIFAEVHECFWREKPSFKETLPRVKSKEIFLVPHFMSSGYFTQEILTREFALNAPTTQRGDQKIHLCDPVGLSPLVTQLILSQAQETLQNSVVKISEECCLILAAHGTERNENSKKSPQTQIELISKLSLYAECKALFIDQEPNLKDWREHSHYPNLVVVPFFISDGPHCLVDIPKLLNIEIGDNHNNPHDVDGCKIWYTPPIGTSPKIPTLILSQIEEFKKNYLGALK